MQAKKVKKAKKAPKPEKAEENALATLRAFQKGSGRKASPGPFLPPAYGDNWSTGAQIDEPLHDHTGCAAID